VTCLRRALTLAVHSGALALPGYALVLASAVACVASALGWTS
jgi:hypothetical protein